MMIIYFAKDKIKNCYDFLCLINDIRDRYPSYNLSVNTLSNLGLKQYYKENFERNYFVEKPKETKIPYNHHYIWLSQEKAGGNISDDRIANIINNYKILNIDSDKKSYGTVWVNNRQTKLQEVLRKNNVDIAVKSISDLGILENYPILFKKINYLIDMSIYASAADFIRYLVLDKYGGIYMDTDFQLYHSPLFLNDHFDMYVSQDAGRFNNGYIYNGFIGVSPHHPVIKETIDIILDAVGQKNHYISIIPEGYLYGMTAVLLAGGPWLFTIAFLNQNNKYSFNDLVLPQEMAPDPANFYDNVNISINNSKVNLPTLGKDWYEGSWVSNASKINLNYRYDDIIGKSKKISFSENYTDVVIESLMNYYNVDVLINITKNKDPNSKLYDVLNIALNTKTSIINIIIDQQNKWYEIYLLGNNNGGYFNNLDGNYRLCTNHGINYCLYKKEEISHDVIYADLKKLLSQNFSHHYKSIIIDRALFDTSSSILYNNQIYKFQNINVIAVFDKKNNNAYVDSQSFTPINDNYIESQYKSVFEYQQYTFYVKKDLYYQSSKNIAIYLGEWILFNDIKKSISDIDSAGVFPEYLGLFKEYDILGENINYIFLNESSQNNGRIVYDCNINYESFIAIYNIRTNTEIYLDNCVCSNALEDYQKIDVTNDLIDDTTTANFFYKKCHSNLHIMLDNIEYSYNITFIESNLDDL